MAVLNNSGDDETMLARNLQKQTYASGPKAGEHVYTPLVAYTLMIFILLYFPCIGRHGGDPQRGRRTLGAVHPVLHNGLSMVIVSARLSDRKPFLTGATTCRKS